MRLLCNTTTYKSLTRLKYILNKFLVYKYFIFSFFYLLYKGLRITINIYLRPSH